MAHRIKPDEWVFFWTVIIVLMMFFLLMAIGAANALAEYRPCLDTLAGAQYSKELETIPNHIGIGLFAETFGDAYKVVEKELKRGREVVRVNLLWSDTHSFNSKSLTKAKNLTKKYQTLCKQYPGKLEINPFTEHNLKNPDPWLDQLQSLTTCRIINNPWKGNLSKKYKNEVHGSHAKPGPQYLKNGYNYSCDGTNCFDINFPQMIQKHSQADMVCHWAPWNNLRYRSGDTTPRAQRIKEAKQRKPGKRELESQIYQFTPRSPTKFTKVIKLAKSHADKHDASDQKGNKLLLISTVKTDKIELKRQKKKVCTLQYYGPYDGGGHRYYGKVFGFECGKDLDIEVNGKKEGTLDAGFRCCNFR